MIKVGSRDSDDYHLLRMYFLDHDFYYQSLRHIWLSKIVMPFGKYENYTFDNIPLKYLDETISPMPTVWIVERAREYVSLSMEYIGKFRWSITNNPIQLIVPNKSWNDFNFDLEKLHDELSESINSMYKKQFIGML